MSVRVEKSKSGKPVVVTTKPGGITCRKFKMKSFGGKTATCREVCWKKGKMISNKAASGCK